MFVKSGLLVSRKKKRRKWEACFSFLYLFFLNASIFLDNWMQGTYATSLCSVVPRSPTSKFGFMVWLPRVKKKKRVFFTSRETYAFLILISLCAAIQLFFFLSSLKGINLSKKVCWKSFPCFFFLYTISVTFYSLLFLCSCHVCLRPARGLMDESPYLKVSYYKKKMSFFSFLNSKK